MNPSALNDNKDFSMCAFYFFSLLEYFKVNPGTVTFPV